MATDYRKVCLNLFGTDDITELKKIADIANQKNPRNAGRKKRFTPEEIHKIRKQVEAGVTINDIAKQYGTHRQIISKYINNHPTPGCTMRITYMHKTKPCTIIDVDFLAQQVYITNKTDDLLHRAFGIKEKPTWADFEQFLADRCFPASRGNVKELLKELGTDGYDPLQIVEKTRGRTAEDNLWMNFKYYPVKG